MRSVAAKYIWLRWLGMCWLLFAAANLAADPKQLFRAAKKGDSQALTQLIESGVDVNATDRGGRTSLWFAAQKGHLAAVELLLAASADLTSTDKKGRTARAIATKKKRWSVVRSIDLAEATRANTEDAYEKFKQRHPRSAEIVLVDRRIEELHWQQAQHINSKDSFGVYIKRYPKSERVAEAERQIDHLTWAAVVGDSEHGQKDLQRYLAEYPAGLHATEAKDRIQQLIDKRKAERRAELRALVQDVKIDVSRNSELWFEGIQMTSNVLCAMGFGGDSCKGNSMQTVTRRAPPREGHVYLLVEADLLSPTRNSIGTNDMCFLTTKSGDTYPSYTQTLSSEGPAWTGGSASRHIQANEPTKLKWLLEVPVSQTNGAKLFLLHREYPLEAPGA